jgi:hypothetical protein
LTQTGIRRAGPPVAVQKIRENFYLLHIALNEPPTADWKRLFYDIQRGYPPEFPPRAVEISGAVLRFRSDAESVQEKLGWVEKWIARANEKEAAMGVRSEEERRRREELAREHQELAELNERWAKL